MDTKERNMIRSIAGGFAPVIDEKLDKLRHENTLLRSQNEALRSELKLEIATLKADALSVRATVVEILERHGLPTDALTAPVRRLS